MRQLTTSNIISPKTEKRIKNRSRDKNNMKNTLRFRFLHSVFFIQNLLYRSNNRNTITIIQRQRQRGETGKINEKELNA